MPIDSLSIVRPGAGMNKRNWETARWIISIAFAAVVLVVLPLVLIKSSTLGFLPLIMASGPLMAALWLFTTNQIGASLTENERTKQAFRDSSLVWLVNGVIIAVIIGIGAFFALLLSGGWMSYDVLKSLGWISYALLGGLAVAMFAVAIWRLLAKRTMGWTIACAIISLLAPWFWAGFAAYAQYHTL